MPIQLSYDDEFKRANPQAFARFEHAEWDLGGGGGLQMKVCVYASKAACDAGGKPVLEFDRFVPFDTTSLTGSLEQWLMANDGLIKAGSPQQVAA